MVTPTNQSYSLFWKKKETISYLLSVFVFLIHISSFSQYPKSDTLITLINSKLSYFFTESFTFIAVPLFFILSGASFFRNYDNSKYVGKLKSRVPSLLIPYLVWNTLWMLFEIICSYTFLSSFFIGRPKFELSLINVLKGIFFYQCNGPFWFIFNLMAFSLASPLIDLITRNKYVGLLTAFVLSVLLTFNIGLPTSVFFSSRSIVYYLVGAVIGKHYFHLFSKRSSSKTQLFSLLFLTTVILLKNFLPKGPYPAQLSVETIVFIVCALCLWNTFDMFIEKVTPRPFFTRSFAVYAMHRNVGAIITKLIAIILPRTEWLAFPNFIISVILTLVIINTFCIVTGKHLPAVYAILMGNRIKKQHD